MKKLSLLVVLLLGITSQGAVRELHSASEFNSLIANAQVPVVVQFSAYWCEPCQQLRSNLHQVSHYYTESQVILAYVDAHVNPSLKKYLMDAYPTVRTFDGGMLLNPAFVGVKSVSGLKYFIDSVIQQPTAEMEVGSHCAIH